LEKILHFLSSKTTRFLVVFITSSGILGLSYLSLTVTSKDIQAAQLAQDFQLVLPVVKTSEQISVYTITNSSIFAASTLHSFYNGGYPGGTFVTSFLDDLAISETKTYSLDAINVPDGFVGDVVISSDQIITGSVVILTPAITITIRSDQDIAEVGQVITYTYQVTNTSIFTFSSISGRDDKLGAITFSKVMLEPEDSTSGTLTYTAVVSDIPGPLVNTATVSGTVLGGSTLTTTVSHTVTVQDNRRFNYLPIILKN
jgi:hypothetical protein